jgi:hypothetical protein
LRKLLASAEGAATETSTITSHVARCVHVSKKIVDASQEIG